MSANTDETLTLREQLAALKCRPRVGVGVAVQTPQGYVLLKRANAHGAGTWSFPGGHLEFADSVVDCAARETLEEIGVRLHDARILPRITEDFFPEEGLHYITLYVHGWTEDAPMIFEPHKCTELAIVPPDRFPEPLFAGIRAVVAAGLLPGTRP